MAKPPAPAGSCCSQVASTCPVGVEQAQPQRHRPGAIAGPVVGGDQARGQAVLRRGRRRSWWRSSAGRDSGAGWSAAPPAGAPRPAWRARRPAAACAAMRAAIRPASKAAISTCGGAGVGRSVSGRAARPARIWPTRSTSWTIHARRSRGASGCSASSASAMPSGSTDRHAARRAQPCIQAGDRLGGQRMGQRLVEHVAARRASKVWISSMVSSPARLGRRGLAAGRRQSPAGAASRPRPPRVSSSGAAGQSSSRPSNGAPCRPPSASGQTCPCRREWPGSGASMHRRGRWPRPRRPWRRCRP